MICREFGCLFIHVPKTAGQSIEQFFMERLGLDRKTGRNHLVMGQNTDRDCGTRKLCHLSATEYMTCGHLTPQEFDGMFKFAFVRNPYERLVSEYLYRNYFSHHSFRDFVLNKMPPPGWGDQYRHVMPQYDLLHDADGRLLVDFVGRFENLAEDFAQVCATLGFEDAELPHRNQSDKASRQRKRWIRNTLFFNGENGKRHWANYYDAQTREFVAKLYRNDLATFDYGFGDT
jgi:hypothetical protein